MIKNIDYYMGLPYRIETFPDPIDGGYVARVPELSGCITQGDTWEELGAMIEDAKRCWISAALESGDEVPEPVETLEIILSWADDKTTSTI